MRDSGVEAAFAELKDEYKKNDLVRASCHELTHDIGYAAAELYSDVPGTFSQGDDFCASGYYHGAMMSVVAEIGPDEMLKEADTLCDDLRENQNGSVHHYSCVHGLGHGFMSILENELFESLEACDKLASGWERDNCYAGVFMENVMTEDDPNHHPKYLKVDQPFYPCTDVEARYQNPCYLMQPSYVLRTKGNDFAKVFDLCATVAEEDSRPTCYEGLGGCRHAEHPAEYYRRRPNQVYQQAVHAGRRSRGTLQLHNTAVIATVDPLSGTRSARKSLWHPGA